MASTRSCCIPNCMKTRTDNIVLHMFPNPKTEEERFLAWKKAVGACIASLEHDYICKNRKICSDHFEEKYLTWTKRLSCDAVPTLKMPGFETEDLEPEDSETEDLEPEDSILLQIGLPNACRCCLSASGTFDATATYITEAGRTEIYCDMLQDCYGITLSHLKDPIGPACMICNKCVVHLRDASAFREQVLDSERRFASLYIPDTVHTNPPIINVETLPEDGDIDNSECLDKIRPSGEDEDTNYQKSSEKLSHIRKRRKIRLKRTEKESTDNPVEHDGHDNDDDDAPTAELSKDIELQRIPNMTEVAQIIVNEHLNSPDSINVINKDEETGNDQISSEKFTTIGKRRKIRLKRTEKEFTDNPVEHDSHDNDDDTPPAKLSKGIELKNLPIMTELVQICVNPNLKDPHSTNVTNKGSKHKPKSKKNVSDYKNISLNCNRVIRCTTACPFRYHKTWLQCIFCSESFMKINLLRDHTLKYHHNVEEELIKIRRKKFASLKLEISNLECRICNLSLTDVNAMSCHLVEVHKTVIDNQSLQRVYCRL